MDLYEYDAISATSGSRNESKGEPESGAATPVATEQPTLNEEVQQAFVSLNRFWGGFRKQVSLIFLDIIIPFLIYRHSISEFSAIECFGIGDCSQRSRIGSPTSSEGNWEINCPNWNYGPVYFEYGLGFDSGSEFIN